MGITAATCGGSFQSSGDATASTKEGPELQVVKALNLAGVQIDTTGDPMLHLSTRAGLTVIVSV